MADDSDIEVRASRWALRVSVAALILVGCLVFFWTVSERSTVGHTEDREFAVVTFVVGGMMKSRSGAT